MPESHPAACRRSAERRRRRAEAATDALSKLTWLKFAEEWTKLADEAELPLTSCLAKGIEPLRAKTVSRETARGSVRAGRAR
jgi:hypothetical protein